MNATKTAPDTQPRILIAEDRYAGRTGYVEIHGTPYAYSTLDAGEDFAACVRLSKNGCEEPNTVTLLRDGRPDCTCQDFIYRRKAETGLTCKHIDACRECGLFGTHADAPDPDDEPAPTPETVADELLAGEAEGADLGVMLARALESFGETFADTVAGIIDDRRESRNVDPDPDSWEALPPDERVSILATHWGLTPAPLPF